MECFHYLQNKNLAIDVYVQPRASKNRIAGLHGKAVKLCVTAPPVDDKANGAVISLLADIFSVPRSAVSIKSGRQSRNKKVLITNLTLAEAQKRLASVLSKT